MQVNVDLFIRVNVECDTTVPCYDWLNHLLKNRLAFKGDSGRIVIKVHLTELYLDSVLYRRQFNARLQGDPSQQYEEPLPVAFTFIIQYFDLRLCITL